MTIVINFIPRVHSLPFHGKILEQMKRKNKLNDKGKINKESS